MQMHVLIHVTDSISLAYVLQYFTTPSLSRLIFGDNMASHYLIHHNNYVCHLKSSAHCTFSL